MRIPRRALLGALPVIGVARAQEWPARPIRILVGYVPGGGADITIRLLAPRLAAELGQPVLVENRPGGAGNLSNEVALRAAPDGHTLLIGTIGQMTVNTALTRGPMLDPVADSTPIAPLVQVTNLLVVPSDRPWRSVAELVAAAKAAPGILTYGSSSVGSAGHLAGAVLDQAACIQTVHVPYRGGGQLIADLISGKVDFAFATAATTVQHVEAGRLRALAVPTAARSLLLPAVPTVAETGVPGFDVVNWYGLVGPRGLPSVVVARLHAAATAALGDAEIRQKLAVQGLEPLADSPAGFGAFLRHEQQRWAQVVRAAGITAD